VKGRNVFSKLPRKEENMQTGAYGMKRSLDYSFETAIAKVTEELAREGFGVLTEIDVRGTLKKKLDVEFKSYKILGACNPHFAYQALLAETEIGLLLPCNVIVYEDKGKTTVSILDPMAIFGLVGRDDVKPLAEEVKKKLVNVLERL
jgi:uncharacterized protein (DUF302 family)